MFVVVILSLHYPSPTNCGFLSIEMRTCWSNQHFTKKNFWYNVNNFSSFSTQNVTIDHVLLSSVLAHYQTV